MRKTILAVLSSIMTISLCACSASGTAAASASASASESGKASPAATAAEEMVEVTIPFSMMATEDVDDNATQSPEDYCAKIIKKYGVTSCVVETDDVRLTMTKTRHEELLAEMRSEIDETIQEILKDEDCQDIKDIQCDDDVTAFTVKADSGYSTSSKSGFALLGLCLSGAVYHEFANTPDQKITLLVNDATSGSQISRMVYPDDFQDWLQTSASPKAN